jgi:hypothetical protein
MADIGQPNGDDPPSTAASPPPQPGPAQQQQQPYPYPYPDPRAQPQPPYPPGSAYPPYGGPYSYPYPYPYAPGGNGMAISALVVGIFAIACSWVPLFDLVLAVTALGLGLGGRARARFLGGTGDGMATAGAILGGISVVITVASFVLVVLISQPCSGVAASC